MFTLIGALLGPALVVGLALSALKPDGALRGKGLEHQKAAEQRPWDIVLIGASFVWYDFDAALLAERLGSSQPKALLLGVPNGSAPTCYAILKERVYGNGLSPKLVVLPLTISTLLQNRLPAGKRSDLLDQMPVPDEVVMRREVAAGVPPLAFYAMARRADLRDPILEAFRDLIPRALLHQDAEAVNAAGELLFRKHEDRAPDQALLNVAREDSAEAGALATDPDDSYLADMVRLAQANGAAVAVVLPPVAVSTSAGVRIDPDAERAARAWAVEHGVIWLDNRDLGWDRSRFQDTRHMRRQTARDFTELVADQLIEADAMSGATRASRALTPTSVTRTGTPPPLPPVEEQPRDGGPCEVTIPVSDYGFLSKTSTQKRSTWVDSPIRVWEGDVLLGHVLERNGCTGTSEHRRQILVNRLHAGGDPLTLRWSEEIPDVGPKGALYWVYPGTTLTWSYPSPPAADAGPLTVLATAVALGPGKGDSALLVNGQRVPFDRAASNLSAQAPLEATGAWTVAIESASDGPFLALRSLDLRQGDPESGGSSTALIPPQAPSGVDLLTPETWSTQGRPPRPPRGMKPTSEGGEVWFKLPYAPTTDCTPLRVEHAGEELPLNRRKAAPGSWIKGRQLFFEPLPGTDPLKDYALVYAADHVCASHNARKDSGQQVWLFPGETLKAEVPAVKATAYDGELSSLSLTLAHDGDIPEGAGLRVRLTQGDTVLVEALLTGDALQGDQDLPLSAPIVPEARGQTRLTLRLEGDAAPVLVLAALEGE